MHPADIKAAIQKAGQTQLDISESTGRSPAMVSAVVNGKQQSLPVAEAISQLINLPIEEIWPHWYAKSAA